MVREGPVRLEVGPDDVELRKPLENGREHHSRHPVRGVDDHAKRPDGIRIDEGKHLVDECVPDVELPNLAAPCGVSEAGERAFADLREARVAADGQRSPAHDLHARVVLRVVRGGDADAAVEALVGDREVDHLGADEPDVDHVCAAVRRALDHCGGHRGRGETHIAPHGDRARLEMLHVRAAHAVRAVLVELRGVEAANVVGLEHLGVEHGLTLEG